jgi:DNA-binding CsgD family transcriptional regulator/sugar-specific transcriptional regulator TrmB
VSEEESSAARGGSPLSAAATELYLDAVEAGTLPDPGGPVAGPLQELLDLGLLRPAMEASGYVAVDPESAAEQQLRRSAEQLAAASALRGKLASLTTAYRAAQAWGDNSPTALVRYFEGSEAITQQLGGLYQGPLRSVRTIQPGGPRPAGVLEQVLPDDLALLRRGVLRQILYQEPARRHKPTQAYVRAVTAAGAEVRTLPSLPDRLFLFDECVVYPLDGDNATAVFNREPSVVSLLHRMFAEQWSRAVAFESSNPSKQGRRLTERQRMILSLSCEHGLAAESIGRRMGLSTTTINRSLGWLRKEFDAPSLVVLAWKAREAYPAGFFADPDTAPGPGA